MTPEQSCQAAESNLATAKQLLLDPRPDNVEKGLEALSQVIGILENVVAGSSRDWDPAVHLAFYRIQTEGRNLQVQIEHARNLIQGWMQIHFGTGYTQEGQPEFVERQAERHFEI